LPVALSRILPEQVQRAWLAEASQPIRQRQRFKFGEIADALARRPGRQEVDRAESARIGADLVEWFHRGEFAAEEVLASFDDPPHFRPLKPSLDDARRQAERDGRLEWRELILTRPALKTYLVRTSLDGASRLFREWFSDADRHRKKPGPKPTLRDSLGAKMLDDLITGGRTPEELKADKLIALAYRYGGSQNTADAARGDALSRFSESQESSSE
jgi:hypothetical protein